MATSPVSSLHVTKCDANQISYVDMRSPLKHITVAISNADEISKEPTVVVQALHDSGAKVAVIGRDVVDRLGNVVPIGTVKLAGITGQTVTCQVVRLLMKIVKDEGDDVSHCDEQQINSVCVTCPVVDGPVNDDLILPLAVIEHLYEQISKQQHKSHTLITDQIELYDTCNQIAENDQDCNINVITRSGFDTDVKSEHSDVVLNENSEIIYADDSTQNAFDKTQTIATRDILIGEQKADESLKSCLKLLAQE